MKLTHLSVGLAAACLAAGSHAAISFSEGFDNVAGLAAAGWVFTNSSSPAGSGWFQGNDGIFLAQSGGPGAYAAVNFNSTTAVSGSVDNGLISPVLALAAGSALQFYTRASDSGFLDLLEVRFSSGSSTDTSSFATLIGSVGSAATASYPIGSWVAFTMALPMVTSGRFAFHYSVANALDASYIGIDSVSVSAVPEPTTLALLAFGLAAIGAKPRHPSALSAIPASH